MSNEVKQGQLWKSLNVEESNIQIMAIFQHDNNKKVTIYHNDLDHYEIIDYTYLLSEYIYVCMADELHDKEDSVNDVKDDLASILKERIGNEINKSYCNECPFLDYIQYGKYYHCHLFYKQLEKYSTGRIHKHKLCVKYFKDIN